MIGIPLNPADSPTPPKDATLFVFPPGLTGTMFFGSFFFGAMAAAATVMFISDRSIFSFGFMVLG